MFSPIYSAGGVYVPKTMYLPFRGAMNPAMLNYYPTIGAGGVPVRMTGGGFYASGGAVNGDGPAQIRKLFIGGLNHETSDEQLRDYYSQWGTVVDCIVIRDPVTKHSRGFGFVTFQTVQMCEAAMADRPHTINGKVVDPKRAIPREQMLPLMPNNPPYFLEMEPPSGCKLTLSGIHWDFHTVDGLRQHFENFGEVEQVEILGHPRGFGFIVFEERSAVERCLQTGKFHSINGRKIEVKETQSEAQNSPHRRRHHLSASVVSNESSAATPESTFSEDNASNTSKSDLLKVGGTSDGDASANFGQQMSEIRMNFN